VASLGSNSTVRSKSGRKRRIAFIVVGVLLLIFGVSALVNGGVILYLNMGTIIRATA